MKAYLTKLDRRQRRHAFAAAALWDLLMLFVLLAVILATCGAHAATVLDASVIVRVADGGNMFSGGSGTIIDGRNGHSLVITNGHLFRDSQSKQVSVQLRDGRVVAGRLVKWSLEPDLALISIAVDAPAYSPLAATNSEIDQASTIVGKLACKPGRVYTTGRYLNNFTLIANTEEGDSGGGVFNDHGQLIGVLWGHSFGEAFAVPLLTVRQFLADLNVRETACRWQRDQCGNWVKICDMQPPTWTPPQQPTQPVQPPQIVPQPPKQDSQLVEIKQNITNINQSITTLQNQIKQVSGCDCSKACGDVEARLNAKIETLAAAHTELKQQIATIQNNSSATPNYDAIADEMAKRLKHSATVTLLDGTKQTQTRPLSDPLEFNQHVRPKQ